MTITLSNGNTFNHSTEIRDVALAELSSTLDDLGAANASMAIVQGRTAEESTENGVYLAVDTAQDRANLASSGTPIDPQVFHITFPDDRDVNQIQATHSDTNFYDWLDDLFTQIGGIDLHEVSFQVAGGSGSPTLRNLDSSLMESNYGISRPEGKVITSTHSHDNHWNFTGSHDATLPRAEFRPTLTDFEATLPISIYYAKYGVAADLASGDFTAERKQPVHG